VPELRYASIGRSLLPYNRSLLPYNRSLLPYNRALLPYNRSLLPYNRSLLTLVWTSGKMARRAKIPRIRACASVMGRATRLQVMTWAGACVYIGTLHFFFDKKVFLKFFF